MTNQLKAVMRWLGWEGLPWPLARTPGEVWLLLTLGVYGSGMDFFAGGNSSCVFRAFGKISTDLELDIMGLGSNCHC